MKLQGNKILITGGGTGIGLGLTEKFLAENNTVIICGRRESVLKEISDKYPNVITKVCDVSKEEDRVELYQWIATNHPDTNVLINNAGILQWLSVTDADFFPRAKQELATNIEAPIHLSSLFIGLENWILSLM